MDDSDGGPSDTTTFDVGYSRQAGYSGNFCDNCGSVRMIRAGTCELCSECGTTTGCS